MQDQALLGEYLASHSFVVATSPSQLRLGDQVGDDGRLLQSAEQQARDLFVILNRLRSFPHADVHRLAVLGYSFGARSALLFALRETTERSCASTEASRIATVPIG